MSELVFLTNGKKLEPYTTTAVMAECTGITHRKIKDAVRRNGEALKTFGKVARYQATLESGQKGVGYRLNEPQATFLMTLLKNTPVVLEFKKELVRQFYAMREYIRERQSPIWADTRALGKQVRKEETEAVKALVEYAKGQGSQHAERYYILLSRLADASAGVTDRDAAAVMQLNTLLLMERLISKEIHTGIECGKHYADIYRACKDRLARFVSVTG